jgi:hypothetical protein
MKLYRSRKYPTRWYAYQPGVGFLMFPATVNGWDKRQQARGLDPLDVREVPLSLAVDAGIPASASPRSCGSGSEYPEAA